MSQKYNQLMKLIIIGDSGTGKSCLLARFVEDRYIADQTQTIGVEFGAKVVNLMNKRVKLQMWDTAGQERYRSVTRSYYRGAVGCLLVYDVTCRESWVHVPMWLSDARMLAGRDIVVMLVGNKVDEVTGDSPERRQVTHNEASLFAQENGLMHLETSAATGEYVEEAFLKIARQVLVKQEEAAAASNANGGSLERSVSGDGAAPVPGTVGGGGGGVARSLISGEREESSASKGCCG